MPIFDGNSHVHRSHMKMAGIEIVDVPNDFSGLGDDHKFLLSYFNVKKGGKKILSRKDINPAELTKFLPCVTLIDLEFDETGELNDMCLRLVGTALVDFYGEWTGKKVMSDDSKTGVKNTFPETHMRIIKLGYVSLEKRKPFMFYAKEVSPSHEHLKLNNLVVPLSNDDENINMLFVYSTLTSNT